MISANPSSSRNNNANNPPASQDEDESPSHPRSATAVSPRGGEATGGNNNRRDNDDASSVARAAAEVSVMRPAGPGTGIGGEPGGGGTRARPPGAEAANAAIQGTTGEGGEETPFEVVDEGGELVRVRFHEFLQN